MPCGAVNQHTLRELFLALSGLILFNPFWLLSGDAHRGFCNPLHVLKKCGIFDRVNSREDKTCDDEETVGPLILRKEISTHWIAKQKCFPHCCSVAYLQTAPWLRVKEHGSETWPIIFMMQLSWCAFPDTLGRGLNHEDKQVCLLTRCLCQSTPSLKIGWYPQIPLCSFMKNTQEIKDTARYFQKTSL